MQLEHVNLTVADLARSVAFYTDVLGLRVRWRGTTSAGRAAAHVGADDWYLALFEADPEAPLVESYYEQVGFNHLGLLVGDLEAARQRLLEAGVRPHSEQEYEPGRRLYFLDPDGIEVELVQYAEEPTAASVS